MTPHEQTNDRIAKFLAKVDEVIAGYMAHRRKFTETMGGDK
jgi:hypothetical protein